jgi:hypothetical protein
VPTLTSEQKREERKRKATALEHEKRDMKRRKKKAKAYREESKELRTQFNKMFTITSRIASRLEAMAPEIEELRKSHNDAQALYQAFVTKMVRPVFYS